MEIRIYEKEKIIEIIKGSSLKEISEIILIDNNYFEKKIYYYYLRFYNALINEIDYGEFKFHKSINLIKITKIISKPSNVYNKFTIIDGWQEYQLNQYMNEIFGKIIKIDYNEILADTYNYNSNDSLEKIINLMKKNKIIFFSNLSNDHLLKKYSINEIMTIASLVEKEGIDQFDKEIISSVIINRLEKKMKLQIDASTIFSITKGKSKFKRKLILNDLEIKDKYNTYYISKLPPKPICFVSRKTIEIVLENYKSNYLFYYYDSNINKHIYSNSYVDHSEKLKKYRKNDK